VLNLANNLLGKLCNKALINVLPQLKYPPKKLNLENNLLNICKYKLNKRMEQQELFKHQIYVEKEEMKNDPVELEQVFKDINK
jgi:hypothetical protein